MLGRSLGVLGRSLIILGRSLGVLGCSLGVLGRLGMLGHNLGGVGCSLVVLGRSLGVAGCSLDVLGHSLRWLCLSTLCAAPGVQPDHLCNSTCCALLLESNRSSLVYIYTY